MAKNDVSQLCWLLVLALSIGFLVWGFMELLKKPQDGQATTNDISRQIRGFAFIMLSQVVLVLGGLICFGVKGGMGQISDAVSRMAGGSADSMRRMY